MALASADTDEVASILQINGKGWDPKLFISKISDIYVCKSCNAVCKDAVELGCDHQDAEIEEFCQECLAAVIRWNNNECPIDASHKNAPVVSARALRRQILALQVFCPNSVQFKSKNDDNNIDESVNMVYDTLDEKEGGNVKYKNNNNNNGKQQECEWKGTLKQLITDHIKNCTVISDDMIIHKIKTLTKRMDEISAQIDKNKNDNNKVVADLNDKIKELKDSVNGLSELLRKQQKATDNKLSGKNEEIIKLKEDIDGLKKQQETTNDKLTAKDKEIANQKREIDKNSDLIKQQQNDINIIKQKLNEKNNEIKKIKSFVDDAMDEKKKSDQEPEYHRHNTVVHNYDITKLIKNGWKCVYNKPYSHNTTTKELKSLCANSPSIEILVGAYHKDNKNKIILGAFGPSSVLHRITNEKYKAFIPSDIDKNYKIYWYHNTKSGMKSFGFSSISKVECCNTDYLDENGDDRLSWFVTGVDGGYRVGSKKHLYSSNDYFKIVYIKEK